MLFVLAFSCIRHDLGVLSWTPSKTAQSADLLNSAADLRVESCIHPGHREAFRIHVHVLYQCFDLASSYTIQLKAVTLFASCIMTNEVCWHTWVSEQFSLLQSVIVFTTGAALIILYCTLIKEMGWCFCTALTRINMFKCSIHGIRPMQFSDNLFNE